VEGSITTLHDAKRIQEVREQSKLLVTIGACATSGGIQSLRNYAKVTDMVPMVYAKPEYIHTLDQSTPIAQHVLVDFELQGCPISKEQLVESLGALLNGRKPNVPVYSVCLECKQRLQTCIMVAQGTPCMGPVTRAGCKALCPSYKRGCFGCYGPADVVNGEAISAKFKELGLGNKDIVRLFRSFNAFRPEFNEVSEEHAKEE
jgi:coenzyme F420-reducing hydrogenase gamma subunit